MLLILEKNKKKKKKNTQQQNTVETSPSSAVVATISYVPRPASDAHGQDAGVVGDAGQVGELEQFDAGWSKLV